MCRNRHRSDRPHADHRTPRAASRDHAGPPAPPEPPGHVRAGDADREQVVDLLRRHAAAGRLDAEELEERVERAYAATRFDELRATLAELPPLDIANEARRQAGPAGPAPAARIAALAGLAAALALVTALTGLWALWWLMWPAAMLVGRHPHARFSCSDRRPA